MNSSQLASQERHRRHLGASQSIAVLLKNFPVDLAGLKEFNAQLVIVTIVGVETGPADSSLFIAGEQMHIKPQPVGPSLQTLRKSVAARFVGNAFGDDPVFV